MSQNDLLDASPLPRSATASLPYLDEVVIGDTTKLLATLPDQSIHMIASDIPYGIGADSWDVLHSNTNSAYLGTSPAQERAGAVFRRRGKPLNGWSEADRRIPHEYYEWCRTWADDWYRVLKPGASAFVFAGRRLQHRCVAALEDSGFTVKDMIAWIRPRAVHRAQRASVVFERRGDLVSAEEWVGWRVGNLRPTFEPILWFVKPYPIGTTIADNLLYYGVGGFNQDDYIAINGGVDNHITAGFEPGESGSHSAQKPVRLMEALISLASRPGQIVLDPFAGSGSTLVAAQRLGRQFMGFELAPDVAATARERLAARPLLARCPSGE
ncbi:MAG TPA: site-specific DNA-methyltransferase [Solirubrobacteraceae bacterium]|jgi:site-specific DNA-methyltransferase (adenine-specific)